MTPEGQDPQPTNSQLADAPGELLHFEGLPDGVRRRVVGYASAALRELRPNQVPPALRPALKWRSGQPPRGFAEQLLSALVADGPFREQIGTAVADTHALAKSVAAQDYDPAADPVDVAALLYLTRPPEWRQRLSAVLSSAGALPVAGPEEGTQRELDALRTKLERSDERRLREVAQARSAEQQAKTQAQEAVDRLTKKVAEASAGAASANQEVERLRAELAQADREARRAKAQAEQLQAQVDAGRGVQRETRLAATARARVLLDLLDGAVAGLREELTFPAGLPRPAELVEARAPAAAPLVRRVSDAADLSESLTLPEAHLIVDGYNVSKGSWPTASLQQQRERLLGALSALHARTKAEITVVFDGADVKGVPASSARGVRVRFSAPGELADLVIVQMVKAEPTGRPLIVVSSDARLAMAVRTAGARSADREVLTALLGPVR